MKHAAVIQRLRQLDTMRQTLQTLQLELQRLRLSPGKKKACRAMGQQLEQTRLWITATEQALQVLTPEERLIVLRLFILPAKGKLVQLCQDLGVEKSSIYRRRDRALEKLSVILASSE